MGVLSLMDKILVVDDDQESRNLLCEVLEANGYAPHAVANGLAAREVLSRDVEYRIVIADLQMPQESGMELLRKLRQENSKHEIILMSSFMSGGEKKRQGRWAHMPCWRNPFSLRNCCRR